MHAKGFALSVVLGIGFIAAGDAAQNAAQTRLTPSQIAVLPGTGASAGTSGVAGIQTRILKGDPTQPGLYTIQLEIPANTQIEAHEHPDDRVATVISGTWYFGYGDRHDTKALQALTPGSFYTEPPRQRHFARTGDAPVVLQITGWGPTATTYDAQPANAGQLGFPQEFRTQEIETNGARIH